MIQGPRLPTARFPSLSAFLRASRRLQLPRPLSGPGLWERWDSVYFVDVFRIGRHRCSLTHCAFGDASKLHGVKAQLGPSKHYVNHRQPWLYGTQGPRRRYTARRTVGKVAQRPWIQRTRQMHHCKSECRARLTREATSTSTRTQNCQLLAQNSVTVPTAALTQLRTLF